MIVDSSALAEQVVADAIVSAFDSAGQRCSALRVLCVQEEVAEPLLAMLRGAMDELRVGSPVELRTDVGPLIDAGARDAITGHIDAMRAAGHRIHQAPMRDAAIVHGTFVAPTLIEIDRIGALTREVFGPVLHVVRWRADELDALLDDIAASRYALTLGIHSRIDDTVTRIAARLPHGNVYVNRNMIGAVVASQPFGGSGMSGTGPKAGGPNYLHRFALEQVVTINTAAAGGNAALLAEEE
jgi:RHH-type proline utilization regulon transcriptional repressor/proline dehydrogenase/delta 1-pyrroline-5-carboxylate dehydrogenase